MINSKMPFPDSTIFKCFDEALRNTVFPRAILDQGILEFGADVEK